LNPDLTTKYTKYTKKEQEFEVFLLFVYFVVKSSLEYSTVVSQAEAWASARGES
jgi:hypothetical protein